MLSFKRFMNCVFSALLYLTRTALVSLTLPYRLIAAMVTTSADMRGISDPENSGRSEDFTSKGPTNDKDSQSVNNHDSDSDDESFTCEYDSTWDDEEVDTSAVGKARTKKKKPLRLWNPWSSGRNLHAAKDMQTYRHDYPDEVDPPPCQIFQQHPNLKFYKNEINSQPDDVSITDFHEKWRGDYIRLERVHTFIQWLFPIREDGVNFQAQKLTKDEIQAFIADESAKEKLRDSYELMLDFYGIKLVDRETGKVERAENFEERFYNLNRYTHNNLRITRILKCLGILGFTHYQAPLVRFFLKETLEKGQLRNVRKSALDYFLFSVLDKEQRKELIKEAFVMFQKSQGDGRRADKFVWCPKWVQKRFREELKSKETGTNRTNQNLDSVDESQLEEVPIEKDRSDSQRANIPIVDGESSESKNLDEDKTSGSIEGGEENKNIAVADGGVEVQRNINDQQPGQSENKPTDNSVSGSSKPLGLDSDDQQSTKQVAQQDAQHLATDNSVSGSSKPLELDSDQQSTKQVVQQDAQHLATDNSVSGPLELDSDQQCTKQDAQHLATDNSVSESSRPLELDSEQQRTKQDLATDNSVSGSSKPLGLDSDQQRTKQDAQDLATDNSVSGFSKSLGLNRDDQQRTKEHDLNTAQDAEDHNTQDELKGGSAQVHHEDGLAGPTDLPKIAEKTEEILKQANDKDTKNKHDNLPVGNAEAASSQSQTVEPTSTDAQLLENNHTDSAESQEVS